jgi:hypothetical protein
MALEPPKAKKEAYWRSREDVLRSRAERLRELRRLYWRWKRRKRGMLVMRDWVTARRV